jgi:hypothetical protein
VGGIFDFFGQSLDSVMTTAAQSFAYGWLALRGVKLSGQA